MGPPSSFHASCDRKSFQLSVTPSLRRADAGQGVPLLAVAGDGALLTVRTSFCFRHLPDCIPTVVLLPLQGGCGPGGAAVGRSWRRRRRAAASQPHCQTAGHARNGKVPTIGDVTVDVFPACPAVGNAVRPDGREHAPVEREPASSGCRNLRNLRCCLFSASGSGHFGAIKREHEPHSIMMCIMDIARGERRGPQANWRVLAPPRSRRSRSCTAGARPSSAAPPPAQVQPPRVLP